MSCEQEQAAVDSAQQRLYLAEQECQQVGPLGSHEYMECIIRLNPERAALSAAQQALHACLAALTATNLRESKGHVTYLRVHEPGTGYGGGSTNYFDADVVFRLDSTDPQGLAFGFHLRDDDLRPVHEGMLAVLREAITHGLLVITDYNQLVNPPNQNSLAFRVAILPEPAHDHPDHPLVNA